MRAKEPLGSNGGTASCPICLTKCKFAGSWDADEGGYSAHRERHFQAQKERDDARAQVLELLEALAEGSANTDLLSSDVSYRAGAETLRREWQIKP